MIKITTGAFLTALILGLSAQTSHAQEIKKDKTSPAAQVTVKKKAINKNVSLKDQTAVSKDVDQIKLVGKPSPIDATEKKKVAAKKKQKKQPAEKPKKKVKD